MTKARQNLGRLGEELAAQHLASHGYEILERNYRCPIGELDIVARDKECIVVVEVRTRRGREYGTPEDSVTTAKQKKLIEVASAYLQEKYPPDVDWRIDVVAIEMTRNGHILRLEIIRDAVRG